MASTTPRCLWFLASFFIAFSARAASRTVGDTLMAARHKEWMSQYGRMYKDAAEKDRRFQIFKANAHYIESRNQAGDRKYKLDINQFADLTNEEFKASYTGFKPTLTKATGQTFKYANVTDVPPRRDWRSKRAVTSIKDQGQCGCCWAFSAMAATEGITQISTGKLTALSLKPVAVIMIWTEISPLQLKSISNGYSTTHACATVPVGSHFAPHKTIVERASGLQAATTTILWNNNPFFTALSQCVGNLHNISTLIGNVRALADAL